MTTFLLYDQNKRQWYQITRGIFGSLKLQKVHYEHVIHLPTDGDFLYDDGNGLHLAKSLYEPKTPEPKRKRRNP